MPGSFTRRQIVATGVASCVLPAIALPWQMNIGTPAPFRAIFDERFDAGHRFAREAIARGWEARSIRGDVTSIWFHELAVRWRQGPAPIAGLTTTQSLFVLERLSWDVGMLVTARSTIAGTPLVHWQIGLASRKARSM